MKSDKIRGSCFNYPYFYFVQTKLLIQYSSVQTSSASESPGKLIKTHFHGSHPSVTDSVGMKPKICILTSY